MRAIAGIVPLLIALTTASNGSQCTLQPGQTVGSGQIGVHSAVPSPAACCTLCGQQQGCVAFTYHSSGVAKDECFLKDNADGSHSDASATSGTLGPSPPPPPPPSPTNVPACVAPFDKFPFCNTSLTLDDRVRDLVSRIHDDEKANLLTARGHGGDGQHMQALPRLGVPAYYWGQNCLHSLNQVTCVRDKAGVEHCPTNFPSGPSFAATFDRDLIRKMAAVIGKEMRAVFVAGGTHGSLDCWGPVINLNRDPRWGRNGEGGAEDPLLMGELAKAWVSGFQFGEDARFLQGAITLKHQAVYSLENSDGHLRDNYDATVSKYMLADYYSVPFKLAIRDAKARGIMCSYNAVNGVPTCLSPLMRAQREAWGFAGYVTSDSDSVSKYVATGEEASCLALTAGGCDINSGDTYYEYLMKGVAQGECSMSAVDAALFNSLRVRFELGLFDPIGDQPYWQYTPADVGTNASAALSERASQEALVLLHNSYSALPLRAGLKLAVLGPHARGQKVLLQPYPFEPACGTTDTDHYHCVDSLHDALVQINSAAGGATLYAQGCDTYNSSRGGFPEALAAARAADVVVLAVGIETCGMDPAHSAHHGGKCLQARPTAEYVYPDQMMELEAHDRTLTDLPWIQKELIAEVTALGKPVVLVLFNAGAVSFHLPATKEGQPLALIEAFYPGPRGGVALAKSLFGQENRWGRLPYTVYQPEWANNTKFAENDLTAGRGRTYRYHKDTPLWPFGRGLSLSQFNLTLEGPAHTDLATNSSVEHAYTVHVHNAGPLTGDVVLLVYFSPTSLPTQPTNVLRRQLVEYGRVPDLPVGGNSSLTFTLGPAALAVVAATSGDVVVAPGSYRLLFEDGSDAAALQASVTLHGPEVVVEPFPE